MMDRVTLKDYAKNRVQGKRVEIWKGLIFLYLGSMVVSFILPVADTASLTSNYVTQSDILNFARNAFISSLITTLLLQPLTYGVYQYLMDFDKQDYGENNTLFAPYKKIFKIFVLSVFVSIVCLLPMIILIAICFLTNATFSTFYMAAMIGFLANVFISYFYVAIPYIFNDMQNSSIIEIMSTSSKMMHGHKFEFFILNLSFVGWYLVALCTCGIFLIWLMPYTSFTFAKYFLDLKEDYFNINSKTTATEKKEDSFTIG